MRAIFTYPNNLATDYIDPLYVGDATTGFTKRIDELLAGTFNAWQGLDPVSDLSTTTSEAMQTFSKFGNLLEKESLTESIAMYDLWNQPIIVATKKLIDSATVSNATASPQPAIITYNTVGAEFDDGLRMITDINGSYTNLDNLGPPLFSSDVNAGAGTMKLRADTVDGPYLRFYAKTYIDLDWFAGSVADVVSTPYGRSWFKPAIQNNTLSIGKEVILSEFEGQLAEHNGGTFYVAQLDPTSGYFHLTYDQAGQNYLQYQLAEEDLPIANYYLYDNGTVFVSGYDLDRVADHQIEFNQLVSPETRITDPVQYGMALSGLKRIGGNVTYSGFTVVNDDAGRTTFDWRTRPNNQFSKLYYNGLTFDQATNAVSFDDELTRPYNNLKNFKTINNQEVLIDGSTIDTVFPVKNGIIWDDTTDTSLDLNWFEMQSFQGHYTNYANTDQENNTFFQPAKDSAGTDLTGSEISINMNTGKDPSKMTGKDYLYTYSGSNPDYPVRNKMETELTETLPARTAANHADHQVFGIESGFGLSVNYPFASSNNSTALNRSGVQGTTNISPTRWYLGAPGNPTGNRANDWWVMPVHQIFDAGGGSIGVNQFYTYLDNLAGGYIGKPFVMSNDYPTGNVPSTQARFVVIPYEVVKTGPYPSQGLAPAGTDPADEVNTILCYTMVINDEGYIDQLCNLDGGSNRVANSIQWSGGFGVDQGTKVFNPVWSNGEGKEQEFNFRMHSAYSLTRTTQEDTVLRDSFGYIRTDERPATMSTGTIILVEDFPAFNGTTIEKHFVILNGGETGLGSEYLPHGVFNQYLMCPYDPLTGVADLHDPLLWDDFDQTGINNEIVFNCSTSNLSYFADINTAAGGLIDYQVPLTWKTWYEANIDTEAQNGGVYALQHGSNASAALPGTTYDITDFNYVNSNTGVIEEVYTPADNGEFVVRNNYTPGTTGSIAPYGAGGIDGTPYEIDTVSVVMPGNRVFGYLNSSTAFVPGVEVSDTKYYLAGGAAERYYSTNSETPAEFDVTVDGNGRISGVTLVEQPSTEGRYSTSDDIALALQNPADEPQPTPTPSEAQDIWDTDNQWMDPGEGAKYWPTVVTPMTATINLNTPSVTNFSQNGTKFTRTSGYTKWTLEVEYPPMTADQFREFHGIAQAANGQAIPFYFKLRSADGQSILWSEFNDKAVTQLEPRLRETIAVGDTTVLMDGFPSFQDNALQTGEVFIGSSNENGALHTAVNTVTSNAYGEARVRIAIPAKTPMPKDTIIKKDPEVAIVTLSDDNFSYSVDTAGFYYLSVSFSLDGWK